MYIDILLICALTISIYMLWRRVSEKIPDLVLIPDQDISVLLEENTAKLQRFFLHIFHFRSFYRERHYHEKFWSYVTKSLFKAHIILLRIDNSIMRLMKRMRSGNGMEIEQRHDAREYFSKLQEDVVPSSVPDKTNRVLEVRTRRRSRFIISGIHPRSSAARMNASPGDKQSRAEEITSRRESSDFRTRIPSGIPRSLLRASVIEDADPQKTENSKVRLVND